MGSREKIIIAILMLIASLCLNAKQPPADLGYDPPEGWEFVMKLDSLSEMIFHCHNDTCLFTAAFSGSREVPVFNRISYDGGETWIDIGEIYPRIFKNNSNTLHRFIVEGNQRFYEKSYDFFKSSEKYPAVNISSDDKEFMESPIDTNILLSLHEGYINTHWATIVGMAVQISRNAGKNWDRLTLYNYPKGYSIYSFNFDWAEKGHWFYRAEDGYDDLDYKRLPPKYFETFDDGLTFREIKFDPIDGYIQKKIIGLDGKNTMRSFTYSQYRFFDSTLLIFVYYYTSSGVKIENYSDSISKISNINWLKLISPHKPTTNIDSGYIFSVNQYYSKTFQFDNNNYSNQFVDAEEITGIDFQKRLAENNQSNVSNSYNPINNWQILNSMTTRPRIRSTFLDQATKTLWIMTFDDPYIPYKNYGSYKGSLWKLKLPWESTSVNDISVHKSGIVIYPNPANDFITIQLSYKGLKPFAATEKVQVFDVLGIEVGQSSLIDFASHNNSQSGMIDLLRIDVSHLSSGVYFIRIGNKVEKFVKL